MCLPVYESTKPFLFHGQVSDQTLNFVDKILYFKQVKILEMLSVGRFAFPMMYFLTCTSCPFS